MQPESQAKKQASCEPAEASRHVAFIFKRKMQNRKMQEYNERIERQKGQSKK